MSKILSIGVMTGTSCDGADLALLRLARKGKHWDERLQATAGSRFPVALRGRLLAAQRGELSIPQAARLTVEYSQWLARLCAQALSRWKLNRKEVLFAVHGQTIWHEPENHLSVQLLDPAIIAARTRCTVTAAFRQPDLARGGQGAPLVAYYHWLRATTLSDFARALPFAIHNIGGIANLTYVSKSIRDLIAFDTGPGNALIDLAAARATRGRLLFDRNGKMAASKLGQIDWDAVEGLGQHPYFRAAPPKSTGRELFNEAFLRLLPGTGAELVANATAFTAHSMAMGYRDFVLAGAKPINGVFIAGGGARNPTLLRLFSRELARLTHREIPVAVLPDRFAPPQFLEPMAFARLGFEALQGNPVSLAAVTGAEEDARGAGIFPGDNFAALLKRLDVL